MAGAPDLGGSVCVCVGGQGGGASPGCARLRGFRPGWLQARRWESECLDRGASGQQAWAAALSRAEGGLFLIKNLY